MFHIRGKYTTNHPKDKHAREAKKLQEKLKGRMCSTNEIYNPTDYNVKRHMKEALTTREDVLNLRDHVQHLDPEDVDWGNQEKLRDTIRR